LGKPGFAEPCGGSLKISDDAVVLGDDSGVIARFSLTESLRTGARATIDALRAANLKVDIISGDAAAKVQAVAVCLGIENWHARQDPQDKLTRLAECRAAGARIVAVGDGINDAPILGAADVAVVFASGAEIAQATGDILLLGDRLDGLMDARAIACDTLRILRHNQRWALLYNCAAVPLAALGLVPPWLAALGMSASSLVVILNALRIGRDTGRLPTYAPTLATAQP
jgi:Cu2+-exporting ATPase